MSGGRQPRRSGLQAEELAEAFLVARGYAPVARNHHTREGEVDLIVEKGALVAFVEVKLRRARSVIDGLESVTRTKQRRIVRAALDYVEKHALGDAQLRFDVIAITPVKAGEPQIQHLENAFDLSAVE
jgi:putative endonuclease